MWEGPCAVPSRVVSEWNEQEPPRTLGACEPGTDTGCPPPARGASCARGWLPGLGKAPAPSPRGWRRDLRGVRCPRGSYRARFHGSSSVLRPAPAAAGARTQRPGGRRGSTGHGVPCTTFSTTLPRRAVLARRSDVPSGSPFPSRPRFRMPRRRSRHPCWRHLPLSGRAMSPRPIPGPLPPAPAESKTAQGRSRMVAASPKYLFQRVSRVPSVLACRNCSFTHSRSSPSPLCMAMA